MPRWGRGFMPSWPKVSPPAPALRVDLGMASETDTAQAVTAKKYAAVGLAAETDRAQALTKLIAVGQAQEQEMAGSVARAFPMSELRDRFDTFDMSRWDIVSQDDVTIAAVAGRLQFDFDPDRITSAEAWVQTDRAYRLTDSQIHAEVIPAEGPGYYTELSASWLHEVGGFLFQFASMAHFELSGDPVLGWSVGGAQITTPYDPVDHRWWRIRHVSADSKVYFDTSPDGMTWTNQGDLPVNNEKADAVQIILYGGLQPPDATPESPAEFDNINTVVLTVGQAQDQELAQAITSKKAVAVGQAQETDLAQEVTGGLVAPVFPETLFTQWYAQLPM